MIEMALLATAKGLQNIDEVERFQLVKSAGVKIEQMMKEKEWKNGKHAQVVAYTVILCFLLFKTGSFEKFIFYVY